MSTAIAPFPELEEPALSPMIAHELITESPLHAWTMHRLLGNKRREPSEVMEKGALIHALILDDAGRIQKIDADDFRTNAAKEARDVARAAGLIPVVAPKYEAACRIAARLRERIAEIRINGERIDLTAGHSEHRVRWNEGAPDGDVRCTGQIDWLRADRQLVLDLKTSDGSTHPDVCAAKLVRGPGVIQEAAYRRSIEITDLRLAGRVEFVFLYAQLVEPYAVTPIEAAGSMRELGESRWARAVALWSKCLAKGREAKHWPSYAMAPVRVEAPAWALARELSEE